MAHPEKKEAVPFEDLWTCAMKTSTQKWSSGRGGGGLVLLRHIASTSDDLRAQFRIRDPYQTCNKTILAPGLHVISLRDSSLKNLKKRQLKWRVKKR